MILRIRKNWIYLGFALLYLTISDVFGLIDLNVVINSGGEGYDLIFVVMMACWGCSRLLGRGGIHNITWTQEEKRVKKAVILLIAYIGISGLILIKSGGQGWFQTISVMREVFYILIFFCFRDSKYDIDDMLRFIVGWEMLGEFIYFVEFLIGPFTKWHVLARLEVSGVWRIYSSMPLFYLFLIPLLIYRGYRKDYLFTKKIDGLIVAALIFFVIIKMGRLELFVTLFIAAFSLLDASKYNMPQIVLNIIKIMLLGGLGIIICIIIFPNYWNRILNALTAIINIGNERYSSNLHVRTSTVQIRYYYLKRIGKLLFGLGPVHNDMQIQALAGIYDFVNKGIIASDTAYGTLLIRYGIVGTIIYVLPYIVCFFGYIRKKEFFCKSIALYSLAYLLIGMVGHAALCFYAPLKYGILLGIVSKKRHEDTGTS